MVGLSVLGVCRGDITDVFNYGMGDIQRGIPLSSETRFRVASISKHVTTIGLMRLYEQGKFKLEDDISDALGFPVRNIYHPDTPITYRMLLSH
jgi:CubicO group peptidase (beta-lactamase class C family)